MPDTARMRRTPLPKRVLATVLFTDIVGSTERQAELGDRRWQSVVSRHHAIVRTALKRFRGREIDTAGDGFFATFDRPAQAIECALAIVAALRPEGIEIRAGVHTGELEVSGRSVGGIAVHTGARVVAAAGPGEILVTATVRDLVAGSNLQFEARGSTILKGVPGEWGLFAVIGPAATAEVAARPARGRSPTGGRLGRGWAVMGLIAAVGLAGVAAAAFLPGLFAAPVQPGVNSVGHIAPGGTAFGRAVPVGGQPNGLFFGEGSIWVTNFRDETLSRIDPGRGAVTDTTSIGGPPTGVTYGARAIWITTRFGLRTGEEGSVVRFSPSLGRREQVISLGSGVEAIAFGHDAVWVADQLRDVVLRIEPATNRVDGEVAVARSPGAIAVGAGSVWVASNLDGTVWRIDPATLDVQARITVRPPTAIGVGHGGVWVTSEAADVLTRIDPATNLPTTYAIGDGPRGVAPAGDSVWVALGLARRVVKIDAASGEVLLSLDVDGFPDAVVIDDRGGVWVGVRDP
jgi:class 3 adenylate cyclase/streptogramin lyase